VAREISIERRNFDVVVFDYEGVCTPSSREFIEHERGELRPLRPELCGVIEELRIRGAALVLLSNEFDREWVAAIEDFPHFDHILVGSDNRIFKPDRRAFQRVLHVLGCQPTACLMVDDDETNVRVARSIGCEAIQFDTEDIAGSWAKILDARPGTEPGARF